MSENKHPCTTIADIRNIAEKIPDAAMSESDKQTFKNGEYETFRLTEPLTVYRYFGAVSADEISAMRSQATQDDIEIEISDDVRYYSPERQISTLSDDRSKLSDLLAKKDYIPPTEAEGNFSDIFHEEYKAILEEHQTELGKEDYSKLKDIQEGRAVASEIAALMDKDTKDWGSDAGGRFLGLNPNLSPQEAKEKMALKSDWGNNEAYLATIEIPAGTEICVGIVGEQTDPDGKILPGGEVQILLPDPVVTEKTNEKQYAWTTEKTQQWIKKCEPITAKETNDLSFISNPNEFEVSDPLKTEEQEVPEPLDFEESEESMMPDIEPEEQPDDLDTESPEVPENQVKEKTDDESKNIM